MGLLTIFALLMIPAAISLVLLTILKEDIDAILLKLDDKFESNYFSLNIMRVIKAYINRYTLTKAEQGILLQTVICFVIGYASILTWGIILLYAVIKK